MAAPRYPSAGPNPRQADPGYVEHGYPPAAFADAGLDLPRAGLDLGMEPDDRIDPGPARRRGDGVIAAAIGALFLIGGGMVLLDDRMRTPAILPPAETGSLARPMPELPVSHAAAGPDIVGSSAAAPEQPGRDAAAADAETAQAVADEANEPPEPLPPPTVDKDDPYQIKALAAGLHPGLARVLLIRLTPEDYANAAAAIRKALSETKDGDVMIWPRQPAAGLAQFRVHFVRGAPDCRRYVVTVSLDRWATTALPMEKCGTRLVEPKPRRDP